MNFLRGLAGLPFLGLQACITTTTNDLLTRSSTELVLPAGEVHVPTVRKGIHLRAGGGVELGPSRLDAKLGKDPSLFGEGSSQVSSAPEATKLSFGAVSGKGYADLFLGRHVRLGAGIEGRPGQVARWGEAGVQWGSEVAFEAHVAIGELEQRTSATWTSSVLSVGCDTLWLIGESCGDSVTRTTVTEATNDSRAGFVRSGWTISRRTGGPWAEAQLGNVFGLTSAPNAGTDYGLGFALLGTGWTERTAYGTLTVFGRLHLLNGNARPSLGMQWTGGLGGR